MRAIVSCLLGLWLLCACRVPVSSVLPERLAPGETATVPAVRAATDRSADVARALGDGAAPGNVDGPGGFVPRGSRRNFYAAGGGRLWYYVNNYYWVSSTAPLEDLWIKGEVVEEFQDLRRWPNGEAVDGPAPKRTMEYWRVGSTRRSVRLDNHKDFCLLSDAYSAGAIVVRVTLTLGHLEVRDAKDRWGKPDEAYVLESRNYSGGGGIGAERARFEALPLEAVNVWGYRIPWSTHPQRITRSKWLRLRLPAWTLLERRAPPRRPVPDPEITPTGGSLDPHEVR